MLPIRCFHLFSRFRPRLARSSLELAVPVSPALFHSTPFLQSKMRKRPLMEPFDKRLLRAMTSPIYPKEVLHPVRVNAETPAQTHVREFNDYMMWLIRDTMARHEVYAFYYRTKPEDEREWKTTIQAFRQSGLMLERWYAEYVRRAVVGTKFENIQHIMNENVFLCHIYEPLTEGMPRDYVAPPPIEPYVAIKEMIRLGRVTPKLTFLGGVVDGELMTRARFLAVADLGSLHQQRAQLCGMLDGVVSATSGLLDHHQRMLSWTLTSLAEEKAKEIAATS